MEYITHENEVVYQDESGSTLARVTFPAVEPDIVEIDHTFVDESLRGQGVAGKLMEHATESLRKTGRKARPTCGYAIAWFKRHPDQSDLLA